MNQANNARTETNPTEYGPINPRCLATVPADLEAILAAFKAQINEQKR